jgi:hypothetical protein
MEWMPEDRVANRNESGIVKERREKALDFREMTGCARSNHLEANGVCNNKKGRREILRKGSLDSSLAITPASP